MSNNTIMTNQAADEAPHYAAGYLATFTKEWMPEGWKAELKYVNDEFQEGWYMNVFLEGSEKNPEIVNIPADSSVPHFMVAKCIHLHQRGVGAGYQMAVEDIAVKAASNAIRDISSLIHQSPHGAQLALPVQRLSDPRYMKRAIELYKEDSKNG